jgi:hypothetical protein
VSAKEDASIQKEFLENFFKRTAPQISFGQNVEREFSKTLCTFSMQGVRSYASSLSHQRLEEFFQYLHDYNALCAAYGLVEESFHIKERIMQRYKIFRLKPSGFGRGKDLLLLLEKGERDEPLTKEDFILHWKGLPSFVEGARVWKWEGVKESKLRLMIFKNNLIIEEEEKSVKLSHSLSLLLLHALLSLP